MTIGQRLARRTVLSLAHRVPSIGTLTVHEGGRVHRIGPGDGPTAEMRIASPEAWPMFATRRGCIDSYTSRLWDSPDLVSVFFLAGQTVPRFDAWRSKISAVRLPWLQLRAGLGQNDRQASRRDVSAHYDLGNDLFEHMLDPTMMYSAAIFPSDDATLEEASRHKLEIVCEKLDLGPDDHLLEIGTGWGGLAIHAATTRGCRVTTTTISVEQHRLAQQRVRMAGVGHLVTVLLEDYRDLTGTYDKLVSIEMIEAVGHRHFDTFFAVCSRLLRNDGVMLLQAITIDDRLYDVAKLTRSFVQTYIFPNGCLPSLEIIARCLRRSTDMRTIDLEDLTDHYVLTLRAWRHNIEVHQQALGELGYGDEFVRLWNLYLAYAEAGFALRRTAVSQVLMVKPRSRHRAARRRPTVTAGSA